MPCDAYAAAEPVTAAPIVILVVEDSVVLRMSVAHYLRGTGYTVIEAGNAQDALGVLATGIHIDLVFTDIQMPGDMDGIALAEQLARDQPTLPVILTSGDPALNVTLPRSVPRRFVRKPYELEALELHIAEFIGRPGPAGAGLS
jgi:CheY-like chemotaxis protein